MDIIEYTGALMAGDPDHCPGNGQTMTEDGSAQYEIACDECPHFLECFPEYEDVRHGS